MIEFQNLKNYVNEIATICNNTLFSSITYKNDAKQWSIAEHIKHLIISIDSSALPFKLPSLILQIMFGKIQRNEYTYSQLEEIYNSKLKLGAKASGKYANVDRNTFQTKEQMLTQLESSYSKFIESALKCSVKKLSHCCVPHPILGKLTLRELVYFTTFHTYHHIESIKKQASTHIIQ